MGNHPSTGRDIPPPGNPGGGGLQRRHLIFGGAAAGLGALAAVGATLTGTAQNPASPALDIQLHGETIVPFYGVRQAGVQTPPQAHGSFIALDLNPGTVPDRVRALLKLLSDDAAKLTGGKAALADTEGEMAVRPARLTVTFGFGPGLMSVVAPAKAPAWLKPLPAFSIDRLVPEFSGGDLLLQICSDDPMTVAHAQRMLLKDSRSFATVKWVQQGFRRARGSDETGTTMRNLFGQVDGTANPGPGSQKFGAVVWGDAANPAWTEHGTSLVIRRIRMDLDKWDGLDRPGRDESIGRRMDNGAPLTGVQEHDEPDFDAVNAAGFPVIADFSHLRRARPEDESQRIYRRAYNYDVAPGAGRASESGLVFASYQADVNRQFVPIQQRLDELDLLNEWTTPVGSAVFAIPPGCQPGGFVGETLFV
ncbi:MULTISPECIES: Dyp-type peroxidase [Arthrobacter]|uniref:Dyp-type peroxidase n=1 Tax=Arthrobacter TaxID=1663 RepID=UPI0009E70360|nr:MULTISPECIES: Dyp-type peroxidase [Arthrobacter]